MGVVVEVGAGGDDPVHEARTPSAGSGSSFRARPGVIAPVSVIPTVTSGSSIRWVKSWQPSRSRPAL